MTSILSREQLKQLGLTEDLNTLPAVDIEGDKVARGLDASPSLIQAAQEGSFDALILPALARVGLRVSRHAHRRNILSVVAQSPIELRLAPETEGVLRAEENLVYLDCSRLDQPLALLLPNGAGALVARDEGPDRLRIQPFEAELSAVQLAQQYEDAWLLERVAPLSSSATALDRAVAVGLAYRLRELPRAQKQARLDALRKGQYVAEFDLERRWAKSLSAEKRQVLVQQAQDAAQALRTQLTDLVRQPRPDDEDWRQAMKACLIRRDELEGVALLLSPDRRTTGPAYDALRELDQEAARWIRTLPTWPVAHSEQLARARKVAMDAWWVAPLDWLPA